jgi:transcriptional regulator with XRE-family HTH domain
MEKKTIGSFIAALRKSNGMTQRVLAERLNVSDKAVSRWERDECAPDLSLIPAIAEILGVTSEEIIRGERILLEPEAKGYRSDAKTEKQIDRILKGTTTRFRALSMISVGITIFGFLSVLFVNEVYGRCNVAFFIGSAFFVAAIIFEIVLFILSYSKIDEDEFSVTIHSPYKYIMVQVFQFIVTLNVVAIFFCLPLVYLS